MPGKSAVTVTLKASGNVAKAKSFPFALKKIMDIPPPNILEEGDDGKLSAQCCRLSPLSARVGRRR